MQIKNADVLDVWSSNKFDGDDHINVRLERNVGYRMTAEDARLFAERLIAMAECVDSVNADAAVK